MKYNPYHYIYQYVTCEDAAPCQNMIYNNKEYC